MIDVGLCKIEIPTIHVEWYLILAIYTLSLFTNFF